MPSSWNGVSSRHLTFSSTDAALDLEAVEGAPAVLRPPSGRASCRPPWLTNRAGAPVSRMKLNGPLPLILARTRMCLRAGQPIGHLVRSCAALSPSLGRSTRRRGNSDGQHRSEPERCSSAGLRTLVPWPLGGLAVAAGNAKPQCGKAMFPRNRWSLALRRLGQTAASGTSALSGHSTAAMRWRCRPGRRSTSRSSSARRRCTARGGLNGLFGFPALLS